MTVKERVGRARYVAFRVARSTTREKAARLLPEGAKLTRFDGTFGIARVPHDAAPLVATMNAGGEVATIATSGTLAGAARRLPPQAGAAKRGPRPPRDQGKA